MTRPSRFWWLWWIGIFAGARLLVAAPLAPDEMDPDVAAATQEDLLDPTLPTDSELDGAAIDAERHLAPPAELTGIEEADEPGFDDAAGNERAPDAASQSDAGAAGAEPRQFRGPAGRSTLGEGGPRPATGAELVRQAFEFSKVAAEETDYDRIIDQCREGAQAGLDGDMALYARRLMAWTHNRRGELRADADRNDAALEDFVAAVRLDDSRWRYVHNRGVALATLGKYEAAIADFNTTLKLNPNYANAWFNRAELLYENRDYEQAIGDYTRAIRLAPKDAVAYSSRGHAYYRVGEYQRALGDYNQAVRLDPKSAAAYTNRGDLHADEGRYAEAAHDYRTAIKLNPRLARAYQSAAWLMATCPDRNYRSPLAVEAAQKAIALGDEADYQFLETLAAAQASVGDFDAAVEVQHKAVDMVPLAHRDRVIARLELFKKHTPYLEQPRKPAPAPAPRQARRLPSS